MKKTATVVCIVSLHILCVIAGLCVSFNAEALTGQKRRQLWQRYQEENQALQVKVKQQYPNNEAKQKSYYDILHNNLKANILKEFRITEEEFQQIKQIETQTTHFRQTTWGMSGEEVRATESTPPIPQFETDTLYAYNDTLLGYKVVVVYRFVHPHKQLWQAKYLLNEEFTNKNNYLLTYNEWVKALTEKYGAVTEKKVLWQNNLYRDDPEQYGMAISVGHLQAFNTWELNNTTITAAIYGEKFGITTVVEYTTTDDALLQQINKLTEEQQNSKF